MATQDKFFKINKFSTFCCLLQDRFHFLLKRFDLLKLKDSNPTYTVFINNINREKEEYFNEKKVLYGGMARQIEILKESIKNDKNNGIEELEVTNIEKKELEKKELEKTFDIDEGNLVKQVFKFKEDGELSLKVKDEKGKPFFRVRSIEEYYNSDGTDRHKAEKKLLGNAGMIKGYSFMIIPIIGFARLEGVAYVVFKEKNKKLCPKCGKAFLKVECENKSEQGELSECNKDFLPEEREKHKQKEQIKLITQLFSHEYEGMLMDWQTYGESIYRESNIDAVGAYCRAKGSKNTIFKELDLINYYKNSKHYFKERKKLIDEVAEKTKKEFRRTATIAILIDSFSHNISAHALTHLNWLFRERGSKLAKDDLKQIISEYKEDNESLITEIEELVNSLCKQESTEQSVEELKKKLAKTVKLLVDKSKRTDKSAQELKTDIQAMDKPLENYGLQLTNEVHNLIRFILEKGTFWNGVTRDSNFGGQIINLYDVLWHDFLNNSLYLGTIASSEGISRINMHLKFVNKQEKEETYKYTKTIATEKDFFGNRQSSDKGELLHGLFASIDLEKLNRLHNKEETTLYVGGDKSLEKDLRERSFFVHHTSKNTYYEDENNKNDKYKFALLANALKRTTVFFPGGLVGKHAFFTLIENEIRNVKHYNQETLKEMQEKGLDLEISIEKVHVNPNTNKIKDPTQSGGTNTKTKELYKIGVCIKHYSEIKRPDDKLIPEVRIRNLGEDIIDNISYKPKLKGTFQDKVCAAMLLNSTFESVEYKGENGKGENGKEARNATYYPWVKAGFALNGEKEEATQYIDYEVSYRKYKEGVTEKDKEGEKKNPDRVYTNDYQRLYNVLETTDNASKRKENQAYVKKFFHVWKGDVIHNIGENEQLDDWENVGRFKFVNINKPGMKGEDLEEKKQQLREDGVVRIINISSKELPKSDREATEKAYQKWLKKWLKKGESEKLKEHLLYFRQMPEKSEAKDSKTTPSSLAYCLLSKEAELFVETAERRFEEGQKSKTKPIEEAHKKVTYKLVHGGANRMEQPDFISYRSNGIFKEYFCGGKKLSEIELGETTFLTRFYEFVELLLTKICIFENRIHKRIDNGKDEQKEQIKEKQKLYKKIFNTSIYGEENNFQDWKDERDKGGGFIKKYHFLVVHLSFIEKLSSTEGEKYNAIPKDKKHKDIIYSESDINNFILYELLKGTDDNLKDIGDNFILIITTGRGRTTWKKDLEPKYKKFVSFAPVEALLNGVERAINMDDDFELKYRLAKVLLGS